MDKIISLLVRIKNANIAAVLSNYSKLNCVVKVSFQNDKKINLLGTEL